MKRHRSVNLLLMLVLLVAVGQMAQTIYIPAIADMARELNVREGAVQSVMAAYLLTYGLSQLVYGPLSDRVGRRPVILAGMSIFMLATLVAITTHSLTVLIIASAIQGMGTGVGGVMARTLPRDLYEGTQLRHANSLLNMGILVSPLLAPLIGVALILCQEKFLSFGGYVDRIILGSVLIVVLSFMPRGLAGLAGDVLRWITHRTPKITSQEEPRP